jgi:hypothetical protein
VRRGQWPALVQSARPDTGLTRSTLCRSLASGLGAPVRVQERSRLRDATIAGLRRACADFRPHRLQLRLDLIAGL